MSDHDILVVGGSGVDTIVRVEALTVPPGDAVLVPPVLDYPGHTGNGVALGFHALGLRTAFVDYIGTDVHGDLLRDRYAEAGLHLTWLPAPLGTPRSVNLVDPEGHRFAFFDGRHPADLRLPAEVLDPLVANSEHVHVSRAGPAYSAFASATRHGRTVSTDLQAWDGCQADTLSWAGQADLVFFSAAGLTVRLEDAVSAIFGAGGAELVIATLGEAGARLWSRGRWNAGQDAVVVPPARTRTPAVDSNGAGDAFLTAFVTSWRRTHDLVEAGRAGVASGAAACEHSGTHEFLIGPVELVERMGEERETAR